jgi:hypothetical protein
MKRGTNFETELSKCAITGIPHEKTTNLKHLAITSKKKLQE